MHVFSGYRATSSDPVFQDANAPPPHATCRPPATVYPPMDPGPQRPWDHGLGRDGWLGTGFRMLSLGPAFATLLLRVALLMTIWAVLAFMAITLRRELAQL